MHRVVRILRWQWAFLLIVAVLLFSLLAQVTLTGNVVLQTDDTRNFAPPYDAFVGNSIISLSHDSVDNSTFHVQVSINDPNSAIYHNIYYYTSSGWQRVQLSGIEWIRNSASVGIEDLYANVPMRSNDDDFFIGVWVCEAVSGEWECGCKAPGDCGYWHVQGIELSFEGETPTTCVDSDGDEYGAEASEECTFAEADCNDDDINVNPGVAEVAYNGVDDDCNATTPDNDLDSDSYVLASDCDDTNAAVHPLATDICENTIDEDCSGEDRLCEQCGEGGVMASGCLCGGTAYWSGFCCDNNYQVTPCGTPEVIFYDGFESGTANTWDYLNPNSRVNQDKPHIGTYSLDLIYTAGGGSLRTDQYASTALVAEDHLYYRYYLQFEGDFLQPITSVSLSTFGDSFSVEQLSRRWQGDEEQGKLYVLIDGTEYATSTVFQTGTWYCMEEEVDGAGAVRVWVDNSLVLEKTGLLGVDTLDYLKQGGLYSDSIPSTMHVYVDDVVVSRMRVGC